MDAKPKAPTAPKIHGKSAKGMQIDDPIPNDRLRGVDSPVTREEIANWDPWEREAIQEANAKLDEDPESIAASLQAGEGSVQDFGPSVEPGRKLITIRNGRGEPVMACAHPRHAGELVMNRKQRRKLLAENRRKVKP